MKQSKTRKAFFRERSFNDNIKCEFDSLNFTEKYNAVIRELSNVTEKLADIEQKLLEINAMEAERPDSFNSEKFPATTDENSFFEDSNSTEGTEALTNTVHPQSLYIILYSYIFLNLIDNSITDLPTVKQTV